MATNLIHFITNCLKVLIGVVCRRGFVIEYVFKQQCDFLKQAEFALNESKRKEPFPTGAQTHFTRSPY